MQGKDGVADIIELMDSYYLTKEDWDAILELGVGPMDMENVKIESQSKTAFTRTYNQMAHPLPYMKASQVVDPKKKSKERPDLEEAIDESDSGLSSGEDEAVLENDDDEPLDLKKDKYIAAPKKKKAAKKASAKGKNKVKNENEDDDDESEEEVKPQKSARGRGKAKK